MRLASLAVVRMRMRLLLCALVLCAACKDKSEAVKAIESAIPDKPAKRTPQGTPRPQDKLTVTLDGKPVKMVTALAWKTSDGQLHLTASSVAVGCDEVSGDMRMMYDGEVTFDVELGNTLQKDGTRQPMLTMTYYAGGSTQGMRTATASTGDGTPGKPVTAEVDFTQKGAGEPHALVVKGTIDALGCAAKQREVPPLPPAMEATIEVAGVKLPIRFAKLDTSRDWPSLDLYTGGEACKQVPYAPQSQLSVSLTWFDKAKPEVSQVRLDGSLVGQMIDQTYDKKKLTITPYPLAPGEITLQGDILVNGYPVKLDGKVKAVTCPKS